MKITDILSEDLVLPALAGRSKGEVIEELAGAVARRYRGKSTAPSSSRRWRIARS